MKVDFNKMSEEEILEYLENISDEEFAELDEEAKAFLESYLEEEEDSDDDTLEESSDEETEEEVVEETESAKTLHPGKGSGGAESKAEMLSTFTQMLAQLGKEDLSDLYNRTVAQIGHEADQVPGSADSNRNTINAKPSSAVGKGGAKSADPMPKLNVKEDIDEMFSGDELSEELKLKAEVVFEAAVNTRLMVEKVKLEEEFEAKKAELDEKYEADLEAAIEQITEELTEKMDQYTTYCVENWMEENELAIENSLRADIAEDFIEGLKNLFVEHYVTIPEEKLDIVNDLKEELDDIKAQLNDVTDRNIELETLVIEAAKEAAFEEVAEGLTQTQAEKLATLIESVDFDDAETYTKKLNIIKESYFKNKTKVNTTTGLITEEIDGTDDSVEEQSVSPEMKEYVKAISKSIK